MFKLILFPIYRNVRKGRGDLPYLIFYLTYGYKKNLFYSQNKNKFFECSETEEYAKINYEVFARSTFVKNIFPDIC